MVTWFYIRISSAAWQEVHIFLLDDWLLVDIYIYSVPFEQYKSDNTLIIVMCWWKCMFERYSVITMNCIYTATTITYQ